MSPNAPRESHPEDGLESPESENSSVSLEVSPSIHDAVSLAVEQRVAQERDRIEKHLERLLIQIHGSTVMGC